jgi:hypothetical protein
MVFGMSRFSREFRRVAVPAMICGTAIELILWGLNVPERVAAVVGIATVATVMAVQWIRTKRD